MNFQIWKNYHIWIRYVSEPGWTCSDPCRTGSVLNHWHQLRVRDIAERQLGSGSGSAKWWLNWTWPKPQQLYPWHGLWSDSATHHFHHSDKCLLWKWHAAPLLRGAEDHLKHWYKVKLTFQEDKTKTKHQVFNLTSIEYKLEAWTKYYRQKTI